MGETALVSGCLLGIPCTILSAKLAFLAVFGHFVLPSLLYAVTC